MELLPSLKERNLNFSTEVLYGTWGFGGSRCYLVFKANQQFVAVNGEVVQPDIYRRETCIVVGRDRTIPFISNIPTTTDAMPNDATWDIYFEDQQHTKRDVLIAGAVLPHTHPSPVVWSDIVNFNNPPGFIPGPNYGISYDQAILLINQMRNQIAGNTVATGMATLVGGQATILDSHVATNSPIGGFSMSENVTGPFRFINRVPGVSFDIASENGADEGNVHWIIYP